MFEGRKTLLDYYVESYRDENPLTTLYNAYYFMYPFDTTSY